MFKALIAPTRLFTVSDLAATLLS